MFHKAVKLEFSEGTVLRLTFQDGAVKEYEMASLFGKYPQLKALKDRELFLSGKLRTPYGIYWNDDLDLEAETVYEDGRTVAVAETGLPHRVGALICAARAKRDLNQSELARRSGIDQSDLSKIERGQANPSLNTLQRIAEGLGTELHISLD